MSWEGMKNKHFLDSNERVIPYKGEKITWRVSAYAVIIKGNKVLLKHEGKDSRIDFPGGGVEPGESLQEALEREVKEEIGAKIKVGAYITSLESWFYHSANKQFHHALRFYYRAELVGERGKPSDTRIEEIKWFDWSEINDTEFQDDVRYINNLIHPRKGWAEAVKADPYEDEDEF